MIDNQDELLAESELLSRILSDHLGLLDEYQRQYPDLCKAAGYGPEESNEHGNYIPQEKKANA